MSNRFRQGDSMYNSYERDDKTVIYKEDALIRINRRMDTVIACTDDPRTKWELTLLKSFLLSTIAEM